MNDWKNDPRLTAFALNELDAAKRTEIEKLLDRDPAAHEEVDAIRKTGEVLQSTLSGSSGGLRENQKARITAAAGKKPRTWSGSFAIAASIILAIGLPSIVITASRGARENAPASRVAGSDKIPNSWTALVQTPNHDQEHQSNPAPSQNSTIETLSSSSFNLAPGVRMKPRGRIADPDSGSVNRSCDPATASAAMARSTWAAIQASNSTPKQFVAPSSPPVAGVPQTQALSALGYLGGGSRQSSAGTGVGGQLIPSPNSAQYSNSANQFDSKQGISGFVPLQTMQSGAGRSETYAYSKGPQFDVIGGTDPQASRVSGYVQIPGYSTPVPLLDPRRQEGTEAYEPIKDNDFARVSEQPLSTFSIDVDTASYANIRRFITAGQLPPPDAVRIEELINYFTYDYTPPKGEEPFSLTIDVAACPWNRDHRLARIGLKGKVLDEDRPPCNLTFLMDVSGSMAPENRLPMLKQAMKMLVRKLRSDDRVAIVTYAGASGLALPSTSCAEKQPILDAFDRLNADGSTNGGEGIQMAYRVAQENFMRGGVNRVILATDGDFNVGVTDRGQLIQMVQEKARGGVFLTVLGVGMGNYKDATLEELADKGNGNYAYLDTIAEARKVLVDQMGGTLVTIAKDVKIQIEFNPAVVGAYRLIGYENRLLAARDFNDDRKDAGEIGAGHTVTALYEIVPTGKLQGLAGVDPLKYQSDPAKGPPPPQLSTAAKTGEMMTVKLRYKQPDGQTSKLIERPVTDYLSDFNQASEDFRFAAAVAAYGMLLRGSPFAGEATFDLVQDLAGGALGKDASGYRAEFLDLVGKTKTLAARARSEPRP